MRSWMVLSCALTAFPCGGFLSGCSSRETSDDAATAGYATDSDTTDSASESMLPITAARTFDDPRMGEAPPPEFNTEAYDRISENPFLAVRANPLSTFSIDVDTASYSNVRRFLEQGSLPPPDAVRIEELVNYFDYDYSPPLENEPFAVHVEVAPCPWNVEHRLARIALKGREVPQEDRPDANLVFLVDVSGSMDQPNKLPLLKSALRLLIDNLSERDHVAIAVYASASGLVLPPTSCERKQDILAALDRLQAGGSTNGGEGIQLAYNVAAENFLTERINRVILCTDGDFNVGVTSQGELTRLIEKQAQRGMFLTVLGFGMGNYKDSALEKLADRGNGNYAYIDTIHEARKVLVEQLAGTLVTIAKDVKIQVDFNPAKVGAYRLIGYENRLLAPEDFQDDTKDAGEIGAGHSVTAFYELAPPGTENALPAVEPSKYVEPTEPSRAAAADELLTVRLRYKQPDADASESFNLPVRDSGLEDQADAEPSKDFRFAAAVAAFGLVLRDSEHKGDATMDMVLDLARNARGDDPHGYRSEFLRLAELGRALAASKQ